MTRDETVNWLKEKLPPKRLKHCLGVEATAVELAKRYGIDPEKAATAGLLHDCAKYLKGQKMLDTAEHFGIHPDPIQKMSPSLLHPYVGACIAKETFGIEDAEILSAIEKHMSGAPEMSLLDKIINVADMIEPGRGFDFCPQLRKLAMKDIDAALIETLKHTLEYIIEGEEILHPSTLETWNACIENRKGKKEAQL